MAKKKVKQIKGFQMNRKTGHPSNAFWQKGKIVKSIGVTHNEYDKAEKIKLKHNVNPEDDRDCYVKVEIEVQKYNDYRKSDKLKNYRFHEEDRPTIIQITTQDKKKR